MLMSPSSCFSEIQTMSWQLKKRIAKMGDGHRLRAKRRAWRKRGEERQEATLAHLLANIKDKGILRSFGEFVISSTSSSLDFASC